MASRRAHPPHAAPRARSRKPIGRRPRSRPPRDHRTDWLRSTAPTASRADRSRSGATSRAGSASSSATLKITNVGFSVSRRWKACSCGESPSTTATIVRWVDGDTVVYESFAIMSYLDRRFPEPPLFGTTPEEHAKIWQRVLELDNYLRPAMAPVVNPIFSSRQTPPPSGRRFSFLTRSRAPEAPFAWSITAMDGTSLQVADLKGKAVVLNIWATWCPPCKAEIPWFDEFQRTWAGAGLVVLAAMWFIASAG